MVMYCGRTRIIVSVEVSICRGYNRADATELCGKILMMSEEEMNNSCDRRVPAMNPGPVVWVQIGLQKPHKRRPSLVVPNRGVRTRVLIWCRRRDLNPHGLRHTPLKRACLPFHHFGTWQELEKPPQLRSRVAQTLNILSSMPRAFASCGLVAGLFETPATRDAETDCHVVSCRASRFTNN